MTNTKNNKKRSFRSKKRGNRTGTRNNKNNVSLITKMPSTGMPSSVLMKMKYTDIFNPSTTTTPHTNVWRLNSLYDPDLTGAGHQYHYFDQMAVLYNRYRVYGINVKISCVGGNNSFLLGMKPQPDTTVITAINQPTERPEAVYRLMSGAARSQVFSKYFPINQLLGISKQSLMDEDNYAANPTTNPSSNYYLQVFGQNPDGSTLGSCNYIIELTAYVKWDQRIRQTQS